MPLGHLFAVVVVDLDVAIGPPRPPQGEAPLRQDLPFQMNSSLWNCPTFPEQPPLCAGVPKVGSQAKLIDVNLKTRLSVQILSFFWEGMIQLLFLFFPA